MPIACGLTIRLQLTTMQTINTCMVGYANLLIPHLLPQSVVFLMIGKVTLSVSKKKHPLFISPQAGSQTHSHRPCRLRPQQVIGARRRMARPTGNPFGMGLRGHV